jgi:hypothetical protein
LSGPTPQKVHSPRKVKSWLNLIFFNFYHL